MIKTINSLMKTQGDGDVSALFDAVRAAGEAWMDGRLEMKRRDGEPTREEMLAAVDNDSIPSEDIDRAKNTFHHRVLIPKSMERAMVLGVSKLFPNHSVILSGQFEYPANGYMGWHTNSAAPGLRLYASLATGRSGFKFLLGDKLVEDIDSIGWNLRAFSVGSENRLWHAVWAESPRLSIGFRVINNL